MATKEKYDLAVIGSGPGGYPAAVRAAQLGLKTVCIEKSAQLGGVCLNSGCIPSKALLDSSELYHLVKHRMIEHGIQTGDVRLDLPAMMARKAQIVEGLTRDVRQLLERNRVDIVHGRAYLEAPDRISVTRKGGGEGPQEKETISATNILLATGSVPVAVPNLAFDGERIVSSTEALNFESVPGRLGIVGGGYVGLELGSVWQRLGADVTVIEMLDQAAGLLHGQVARTLS
ncbi:MAG: FAD-dependent oxidoreductase, partial [Desulfobacterales bacterium]|nr:FAD-dependent oxidoreductase [Desulfobacterales bacterium]